MLTRIWDLPDSGFAERLKHVIEPAFIARFHEPDRQLPADTDRSTTQSDVIVERRRAVHLRADQPAVLAQPPDRTARAAQTREFLTIGSSRRTTPIPRASRYDSTYRELAERRLADACRRSPSTCASRRATAVDATGRVEYDVSGGGLQVLTAGGNAQRRAGQLRPELSAIATSTGTQDADNYLSTVEHRRAFNEGRVTGTYALSWDIARVYVVSQRIIASYMAQCCGLQVEFQQLQLSGDVGHSRRRRTGGSTSAFVLAGLGTFSNFFGAFGGTVASIMDLRAESATRPRHRRHRIRRESPRRAARRTGRRWSAAGRARRRHVALRTRRALADRRPVRPGRRCAPRCATLRPSAVYHCAGSRTSPSRGRTPRSRWRATSWRPITCSTRCAVPASRCRVLIPGSATVYAPGSDRSARTTPCTRAVPTRSASWRRSSWRCAPLDEDGIDVLLTRSFNHTGPRQTPAFVAPSIARQIALIEQGALPPVIRGRQPRGAARPHRRARRRARLRRADGVRRAGVIYNVRLRAAPPIARCSTA